MRSRLLRLPFVAIAAITALGAGCTSVGTTKGLKSVGAPTSLSALAVEFVTPNFRTLNLAAQTGLTDWVQLVALSKPATPTVFARAHVAAVVIDEDRTVPPPAAASACRFLLIVTLSEARASQSRGYHNEKAHLVMYDRRTHDQKWEGETYLSGGPNGFGAGDADEFLSSVVSALHHDGIIDDTAD